MKADEDVNWKRFSKRFLQIFFTGTFILYLSLLIIDPFDSARLPTFMPAGVNDGNPRTANVSRGRDPRFSAAIIGNSRVQLIEPARLSSQLPFSFVQLSVPGSGALEQATLIRWFSRHHRRIDALVFGVDPMLCAQGAMIELKHPFPFWLYRGLGEYLASLYSTRALDYAWRRLLLAIGVLSASDPSGYLNYENERRQNNADFKPGSNAQERIALSPRDDPTLDLSTLEYFLAALDDIPRETPIILVHPPYYLHALLQQGSSSIATLRACKARVLDYAKRRSKILILDYLEDSAMTREAQHFIDADHMRGLLARMIEVDIVAWLRTQPAIAL